MLIIIQNYNWNLEGTEDNILEKLSLSHNEKRKKRR